MIKLNFLLLLFLPACFLFGQKKVGITPGKPKTTRTVSVSPRLVQRVKAQNGLIVLLNRNHLLPLERLDTLKIATVCIGSERVTPFQSGIDRYLEADHYQFENNGDEEVLNNLLSKLARYNLIIAAIYETENQRNNEIENFPLTVIQSLAIQKIADLRPSIAVLFSSPLILSSLGGLKSAYSVVVANKEENDSEDLASQLIFGAFSSKGKLTIDIPGHYQVGAGLTTASLDRLKFTVPEEVGLDSTFICKQIEKVIKNAIQLNAFPGCQILIALKGKVFYRQNFGNHIYESDDPVKDYDLFDLASLTKILAPVPALMKLTEEKKFSVGRKFSDYWPDWKKSNKENLLVSDVLSHQARLRSGILIWPKIIGNDGFYNPECIVPDSSAQFPLRVSSNLFALRSYPDTIYKAIRNSPLLRSKRYVYSDLGFIIFPKIIERLSGEKLENYLQQNFYKPLGAKTLGYLPLYRFPLTRIVPTELDQLYRKELLHGFVHDETAALLGGVSGNAGLFGTATDVAKVMQMYLQMGEYGHQRYLNESTLKDWTSRHFQKTGNRRGYGFDKPSIGNQATGKGEHYPSNRASAVSFGHSGYTGTFVWVDPSNGLLFVFLSNRVYPDRDNNAINRLKVRTELLDIIGELIKKNSFFFE